MNSIDQLSSAVPSSISLTFRDYAALTKLRVTTLVMMTAWCGYFLGAHKAGLPSLSWGLLRALMGIGLASCGTAALNEVMERDVDKLMRRTARRPLPAGRMTTFHATAIGLILTLGGSVTLAIFTNPLTGLLTFATAFVYLAAYTPLKRISPVCTTVGAIPGAMPGVLGWTAARGQLDWGALVMFAILFVWQFPHFFSIAWLYRDDYAEGGIRMLPVVEPDGRSTAFRIVAYSLLLIPVSLLPTFFGLSGRVYLVGAVLLGFGLLYFAWRLISIKLPLASPLSKRRAQQLLLATVSYLPLLFTLMMINSGS